jgi:hypothetical protein
VNRHALIYCAALLYRSGSSLVSPWLAQNEKNGEHAGVEVRIEVVPVQRFDYPQLAAPRRFVGRLGPKHPKLLLGGPLGCALAAISSL